jgi:hypothetical protein
MNTPTIGAIAMIAGLIVTPVVSAISRKFSAEHIKTVFEDGQEVKA